MAGNLQKKTSLSGLLLDFLKELTDEELREFKWNLSQGGNKKLKPIPRGVVKDLDRTDVADKMILSYNEKDALNVMVEILNKMSMNDLAEKLSEELQKSQYDLK